MTKKILSALLAVIMVVCATAFTATAADENILYVEAGATGGDGASEDEPLATLEEAIAALGGKDGTIKVIGELDVSAFKSAKWTGMVTVTAYDEDTAIVLADSKGIVFSGDITFKDINFKLGKNTHFNPQGTKLIMDGGEDSNFSSFMHLCMYGNTVVEYADFVLESGKVSVLYSGGYCTSLANGVMCDSNITINGGEVGTIALCADSYMENQTGIAIGGNYNLIINGGKVGKIAINRPKTVLEIMGALNIVFNNGMQAPETFVYPEETVAGGVFIIKSAEGGMVTPVKDEIGAFELKANKGMIAEINGEQIPDGIINLEPGETEVNWVEGEQPGAEPEEKPIEIKLTIDSKEIVVNGEAKELDVPAQIINDRTMVPLRAIFEALGATVEWDQETQTVTSEKGDTKVKLTIGENKIYVNDEAKDLDVAGQIVESRTLVPARAVAEAYGCKVDWNGETRTVIITK